MTHVFDVIFMLNSFKLTKFAVPLINKLFVSWTG